MRPTLYHKSQNPFRVELAIRARAGIEEFDSKPSSKKAGPQAESYMTSQPNRTLLLFSDLWEVFRKCFVLKHHPLASQPSLSSSLSAYPQEQGCLMLYKVQDSFWMTSEWLMLTLNATASRLLLQYSFLNCSQQGIIKCKNSWQAHFQHIYRKIFLPAFLIIFLLLWVTYKPGVGNMLDSQTYFLMLPSDLWCYQSQIKLSFCLWRSLARVFLPFI